MTGADFQTLPHEKDALTAADYNRAADLVRSFYGDDVTAATKVLAALGLDES